MTRINDHDGCLANRRSLALEVSLQGSSSVTLLAQAEGEAPCSSGERGGLHPRHEGRSIYLCSCFTFSPKRRDAAGAGRWGWPKPNTHGNPLGKHRQGRLERAGLTTDPGASGGSQKRGAVLRSLFVPDEALSQPCWESSSWLQPAWALGRQRPRSSLTQPSGTRSAGFDTVLNSSLFLSPFFFFF